MLLGILYFKQINLFRQIPSKQFKQIHIQQNKKNILFVYDNSKFDFYIDELKIQAQKNANVNCIVLEKEKDLKELKTLQQRQEIDAIVILNSNKKAIQNIDFNEYQNLKWIQLVGIGFDRIADTENLIQRQQDQNKQNIVITNMSTASAVSLAEFTIYCILHFSKSMAQFKKYQQNKEWAKNKVNFDKIQSIQDKSALILGYGNIGKKIAEYLRSLKIKNIYSLKKNIDASKSVNEVADVIEKFNEENLKKYGQISDYIICCLPGTKELHKVLSEQFFSQIKIGCIFINVGRGFVVDEEALVRYIRNGRILGAGLDVTYNEPYSQDYHLLEDDIQDQLILTSHAMDNNVLSAQEYCQILDININHLINQTSFINQINIQKGY